MKLRRQKPADSLDMLLDTMCNAFGGIILLAVLVTLLTRHERLATHGASAETREMLERRLALARTNLSQSQARSAKLHAEAEDPRLKQQVALLQTRSELEEARRKAQAAAAASARSVEALGASDPSERARQLNAEFLAAKARQTEQQNRLAAATENRARLQQRLADLDRQVAGKYSEIVRALRLPKERETGADVLYVIVQYGRVYPCMNSDLSRNESAISWASSGASRIATPIRSKGMAPLQAPAEFQTYLRDLRGTQVYLAFLVFEDSFAEFNRAKQMAVAAGFAFGWEPFRNSDGPVAFGPTGFRPKPQ